MDVLPSFLMDHNKNGTVGSGPDLNDANQFHLGKQWGHFKFTRRVCLIGTNFVIGRLGKL